MTGWNSWDELTQELPRLPPAFFDDPVFRPGGPPPVQDVGPAVETTGRPRTPPAARPRRAPAGGPASRSAGPAGGHQRRPGSRHPAATADTTRTTGRLARSRRRDRGDPAGLAGRDGRHPADPAGRTGAGHAAARAAAAGRPAGPEPEPRPGVPDDGDRLGGQPADRVPAQPGGHRGDRRRARRQRLQHGRTRCPTSSTSCCSAACSPRSSCRCWSRRRSATGTRRGLHPAAAHAWPSSALLVATLLATLAAPLLTVLYLVRRSRANVRADHAVRVPAAAADLLLRHRRDDRRDPQHHGACSAPPAWAPVLNNVVVIVVAGVFLR